MNPKTRTVVSLFSGGTGASVTPEKSIPKKKRNMNPPEMSPPIKYPIPNQDIHILITEQDPSLPTILEKYPPGYKQLFNDMHDISSTEYKPKGSIDNLRNKK